MSSEIKRTKSLALLKALEKVLGQTISSDEMENCSEVDGKTSCERNQFFLSSAFHCMWLHGCPIMGSTLG